jgi:hypothetical protein
MNARRRAGTRGADVQAQLWVESHQPVALVPMSMLKIEPGDVIYIGKRITGDAPADSPGWVLAGPAGLFVCLTTADYFWDDDLDYEQSMGRRLQADESVLVRFTDGR